MKKLQVATSATILVLLTIGANGQQQQPAAVVSSSNNSTAGSGPSLQAHLVQAQRQLGQLNGLVLNAVNGSKYSNVLEAISSVGKAIQQQISAAASNPNHVNIITAPTQNLGGVNYGESANNKKNEYQSIVITDQGSTLVGGNGNGTQANYREQGEVLRQEIVRRAGQLQQVVASSMDLLKNNGDLIVRRLLEQMNVRLDQAKAKADRIINEPATNEVALKALATINLGLNNLNNIISNIVTRLDLANKEQQQQQQANQYQLMSPNGQAMATPIGGVQQRIQSSSGPLGAATLPQLLDSSRIRANLQQLTQQFHTALNGSSLHQQLAALRVQRQQQALFSLTPTSGPATNRQSAGAAAAAPAVPVSASNKINTDFSATH